MRHHQRLDYEGLRREAARAVEASDKTQRAIAEELGKSQGLVSRAIREAGPKLAKVQRELIAHLTDYAIEEAIEVTFRGRRKGAETRKPRPLD